MVDGVLHVEVQCLELVRVLRLLRFEEAENFTFLRNLLEPLFKMLRVEKVVEELGMGVVAQREVAIWWQLLQIHLELGQLGHVLLDVLREGGHLWWHAPVERAVRASDR